LLSSPDDADDEHLHEIGGAKDAEEKPVRLG
jgi:hypothetical protein